MRGNGVSGTFCGNTIVSVDSAVGHNLAVRPIDMFPVCNASRGGGSPCFGDRARITDILTSNKVHQYSHATTAGGAPIFLLARMRSVLPHMSSSLPHITCSTLHMKSSLPHIENHIPHMRSSLPHTKTCCEKKSRPTRRTSPLPRQASDKRELQ